ncbi:N-acetylmuramoyl-L-alanine amidase [Halobacillus seohaensis]|uniref:N-acetylmuramoyl-L-alanine amidase n=1 Tax=Halobacillus seohaensis TaxID=447421 RepID=A0ABW2EK06_9BACI
MKGWLSLLFILAGLIWIIPATAHADSASVQVDNLHVRAGPSLSDSIVGKVHNNETYPVIDQKGDWVKIKWNNKTGWVANWLVKIKQKESLVSKVDYLRIRSKAGLNGTVQGYLMKSEKVTKVDQKGDWVKIERPKASGWVHKDYLSTYVTEDPKKDSNDTSDSQKSLGKVKVATLILNVRSKATTNSSILKQLRQGSSFEYLEKKQGWYKIKLNSSKTGWVAGWLVSKENSSVSKPSSQSEIVLQYNATNLRSGPSTNHKVLGRANKGDQFNVISKKGEWYEISYNSKTAYVAGWIVEEGKSSKHTPTPVSSGSFKGKTIVVDAGHGGFDPGAIGRSGTYEKTLTLQTAQKLKSTLEKNGANVVMTRSNDSYLSLSARTSLSNSSKGDVFISLHYNSSPPSIKASGMNTYFHSSNTRSLASNIQSAATQATGQRDRGIKKGNFHVIRNNNKPSVLIELGFISNLNEEKIVKEASYQKKVSHGITNGLVQYFK